MDIMEQVEKLQQDMNKLMDDLYNTDSENIDFKQLRRLSKFSRNYSIDIIEFIENREDII